MQHYWLLCNYISLIHNAEIVSRVLIPNKHLRFVEGLLLKFSQCLEVVSLYRRHSQSGLQGRADCLQ